MSKSHIFTGRNAVVGASANLDLVKGDVVAVVPNAVGADTYVNVNDPQNIANAQLVIVAVCMAEDGIAFGGDGPFAFAGDVQAVIGDTVAAGEYVEVDLTTDLLQFVKWTGTTADEVVATEGETWLQVGRGQALEAGVAADLITIRLMNPFHLAF